MLLSWKVYHLDQMFKVPHGGTAVSDSGPQGRGRLQGTEQIPGESATLRTGRSGFPQRLAREACSSF